MTNFDTLLDKKQFQGQLLGLKGLDLVSEKVWLHILGMLEQASKPLEEEPKIYGGFQSYGEPKVWQPPLEEKTDDWENCFDCKTLINVIGSLRKMIEYLEKKAKPTKEEKTEGHEHIWNHHEDSVSTWEECRLCGVSKNHQITKEEKTGGKVIEFDSEEEMRALAKDVAQGWDLSTKEEKTEEWKCPDCNGTFRNGKGHLICISKPTKQDLKVPEKLNDIGVKGLNWQGEMLLKINEIISYLKEKEDDE